MMLQDIGPHTLRNQYSERTEPKPGNPVFCFRGAKLLIKKNVGHSFEKEAGLAFEGGRVSMPENGLEWKDEKQFYLERGRFLRLPEVAELEAARNHGDGSPVPSSNEKTENGTETEGVLNLTYLFTVDERPTFLLRDEFVFFAAGIAAFLIGHLFYISLFGRQSLKGINPMGWILSLIVMGGLVFLLVRFLKIEGALLAPMAVYGMTLMLLIFSTLCGLLRFRQKLTWTLLFIGAVLFTFSKRSNAIFEERL